MENPIGLIKRHLNVSTLPVYVDTRERIINYGWYEHNVDYYKDCDKFMGVYLLYREDKLTYIGSSENLYNRLKSHKKGDWDKCRVVVINNWKLALRVELALIIKFKPKNNSPFTWKRFEKLCYKNRSRNNWGVYRSKVQRDIKAYERLEKELETKSGKEKIDVINKLNEFIHDKSKMMQLLKIGYDDWYKQDQLRISGEPFEL